MAPKKDEAGDSLRRLGGGRWQTRDERFTIEPQSGTWVIVDAEQTDDLGLPLVRGPYRSLTDAKAGIADARSGAKPESPLAMHVEKAARTTAAGTASDGTRTGGAGARTAAKAGKRSKAPRRAEPAPPPEPKWLADLPPAKRRDARALVERLGKLGADDPEDIVRGALVRDAPDVARFAIVRRLRDIATAQGGEDAERVATEVAEALARGRDRDLEVGWKLVDDEGRPIPLTADDLRKRLKRG